jgi:tetratricopeptide (TPR) repeat protein
MRPVSGLDKVRGSKTSIAVSGKVSLDEQYSLKVDVLASTQGHLSKERVFECLRLRDQLAESISNPTTSGDSVLRVVQADRVLRRLDLRLAAVSDLAEWRHSLAPCETSWWWFPDRRVGQGWDTAGLVLGCFALALIIDLLGRFGIESLGLTGAALILLPTFLTALSSGGALSETVASRRDRLLRKAGVSGSHLSLYGALLSLMAFLLVLGLWLAKPLLARCYNQRGIEAIQDRRLAVAESELLRATRLNPDSAEAHYNLGHLYEDLFQADKAIKEYQTAVAIGLDAAANNLGRLLLLDGRADAAAQVLLPHVRQSDEVNLPQSVRYRFLKNFAWARLEQGRPAEALVVLEEALPLEPDSAPAHCLMGRAHGLLGDLHQAAQAWRRCLRHANAFDPDEDRWLHEADLFFMDMES